MKDPYFQFQGRDGIVKFVPPKIYPFLLEFSPTISCIKKQPYEMEI